MTCAASVVCILSGPVRIATVGAAVMSTCGFGRHESGTAGHSLATTQPASNTARLSETRLEEVPTGGERKRRRRNDRIFVV